MGRTKLWADPVQLNFNVEREHHEDILENIKRSGFKTFQNYILDVLKNTNNYEDLKTKWNRLVQLIIDGWLVEENMKEDDLEWLDQKVNLI